MRVSNEIITYTRSQGFPHGFTGKVGQVWLDFAELDKKGLDLPKKLDTDTAEILAIRVRNNHVLDLTYALNYSETETLLLTVAPNETGTSFIVISVKLQTNLH